MIFISRIFRFFAGFFFYEKGLYTIGFIGGVKYVYDTCVITDI